MGECARESTDRSTLAKMESIKQQLMAALSNANIHKMVVCGYGASQMESLLKPVIHTLQRDKSFHVIVQVTVGRNPDLRRIKQQIDGKLSGTNTTAPTILFILLDLYGNLDLRALGISTSIDRKLILTSGTAQVLSNMNIQTIFST
ncbi:hypothetical protein PIB30_044863 [Stylosanthes scabra]|uniref:Uncharacterized protein n=1 Tax=Stylosanthes scabra TaxID=79078 RepID=A0ABU6QFD7_9FABA|nr:hypothetical protein [Stylosanthes scabra]